MATTIAPTETRADAHPDLEAWLAEEIEKPCEVWVIPHFLQHGITADWFMSFRAHCPCGGLTSGFVCDQHKTAIETNGGMCVDCKTRADILWIERVRGELP